MKEGDPEAWKEAIERYVPLLRGRWRGQGETDDAIASALREAVRGIRELRNNRAFYGWLNRIVQSKLQKASRQKELRRKQHAQLEQVFAGRQARKEPEHVSGLSNEDMYCRVLIAIRELYPVASLDMTFLFLHYVKGASVTELAEAFGVPEGTIRYRIKRAVRRIGRHFRNPPDDRPACA